MVVVVARADGALLVALFSECDELDGERDCPLGVRVGRSGPDVHESFVVELDLRVEGATAVVGCAGGTDFGYGRFSTMARLLQLVRHSARGLSNPSSRCGVGPTDGRRGSKGGAAGGVQPVRWRR